jgi:hypothetical protein
VDKLEAERRAVLKQIAKQRRRIEDAFDGMNLIRPSH